MSKVHTPIFAVALASFMLLGSTVSSAVEVKLTADRDYLEVKHQGKMVRVTRNQDQDHVVDSFWAKTSRKCPPFCIQPLLPAPGVQLAEEVEVFEFMEERVNKGTGVIIDARVPAWFKKGTIPGSVNVPFTLFEAPPTDPELVKVFTMLGAQPRDNVGGIMRTMERQFAKVGLFDADKKTGYWDFSNVKDIMIWCNGPWCGQSPHAIHALIDHGYPPERIHYYRGGMQMWEMLGLTVVIPE